VMIVLISQSKRLQRIYQTMEPALHFKAVSVISGMMGFDERSIPFWGMRSMCFDRGYKKQETYQNMVFSAIQEIKELPPVFLATSEEDELKNMTLAFEKELQRHQVAYQLRCVTKAEGKKLGHIFSVLNPEYEESIRLTDEMIRFFRQACETV